MSRTSRRTRAAIPCVLAAALAVGPSAGSAQSFFDGLVPPDVRVTISPRPYPVEGDTPELLTAALQAIGLGGYWMRVSSFYEWIYDLEELSTVLGTNPRTGQCRFPSYRVDVRFTVEYPVWQRPDDPDPMLVEAWDAFAELMQRHFEERRSDVYAQLVELNRLTRRAEVPCARVNAHLDQLMYELREEQQEKAQEEAARGERVVLEWPPPGIIRTPQLGRAAGIFLVPSATTIELPPTDPERLLADAQNDASRIPASGLTVMAGHFRAGEVVYFEPAIAAPSVGGLVADPNAPSPYPGLTEVFVATLAGALDSASVVSLEAPIATYLPEIDAELGRVTLRQLLSHRSGIYNSMPDTANGVDWHDGARTLDRRALFTEPGAIYSYSGYDYPLAIWVLESVTRADFPTLVQSALLNPLQLTNTSIGEPFRGVPVTRTTPSDLMAFLAVWVSGGLRGAPSLTRPSFRVSEDDGRWFDSGVWYDEVAGAARVSLTCDPFGFQLFPETGTAFMLWTSGLWPRGVWRYLLSQVGEEQGAREEVLEPLGARGLGALGAVTPTCSAPIELMEQVDRLGAMTPAGDWAGLYRNGDLIHELSDVDGFLKETNGPTLDVSHYEGDVHFVGANGMAYYPLQLTRDTEGRRYLVLDGRAYIHQDDRPTR